MGVTPPDDEREVLEEEREAHGDEHLAQRISFQPPYEEPLHEYAHQGNGRGPAQDGNI